MRIKEFSDALHLPLRSFSVTGSDESRRHFSTETQNDGTPSEKKACAKEIVLQNRDERRRVEVSCVFRERKTNVSLFHGFAKAVCPPARIHERNESLWTQSTALGCNFGERLIVPNEARFLDE